jgi:hypothetical protein
MKSFIPNGVFYLFLFCQFNLFGQSTQKLIRKYLQDHQTELKLTQNDILNWTIYDRFTSVKTGVEHIYIRQNYKGIELYNSMANFAIKNGEIVHFSNRLVANISENVNTVDATITSRKAIDFASTHLNLDKPRKIKIIESKEKNHSIYSGGNISFENIPVKLMFHHTENAIKLVWDLSIYELSRNHWWSVRIDASNGELVDKVDWVVSCSFENCTHSNMSHSSRRPIPTRNKSTLSPALPPSTDQYRVFGLPLESPNHGPRSLIVGPYDTTASPYGWHDDDGIPGADYTVTQGNNVRATEDIDNNQGVGFMPDGGPSLNFDFPLNFNNSPVSNQSAAITNLFYWNNIMHDVYYQYGFDEASGNFQENNYGKGGLGSDYVYAEALDGGGTNNANFATPSDGSNPRMQMYLWSSSVNQYFLTINSPSEIAGQYLAAEASFGPSTPTTALTSNLVLVADNSSSPNEGCNTIINGTAVIGKIALVYRGNCTFVQKVQNAQNAGAVGVIVINNVSGQATTMGGTSSTITIPSIMISDVDGAQIVGQLGVGVNGTLQGTGTTPQPIDGDFDNAIIAHEYGHGISNRLTGGPSASGCLSNAEQMGEGWSDWFGFMLTIEPGDQGTDGRGIGTYAKGQGINGPGIRPTQYSTDFGINPSTYATTNNSSISQPHGIGYVWCTMLWDLNWALVDRYGIDYDVYHGNGGNNIAMALVIEALKLQPCSPGFVDGRNAILAADMLLYNGANQCLIWEVFANRGLGYSASQGSTSNRFDQVEAFDLPPLNCNAKLTIKAFIDGYYIPSSNPPAMQAAYRNNDFFATSGLGSSTTDVDSITIELYDTTDLINPAYTQTKILATNGLISCEFPSISVGGQYYITLKSKNTLELWSANPVLLSEVITYDFSNSISKAYTNSSLAPMKNLAPGLFGIYTGDLNQDGFIDSFDYSVFVSEIILSSGFTNFFLPSDMNGDGFVDSFDYPIYNLNATLGATVQKP